MCNTAGGRKDILLLAEVSAVLLFLWCSWNFIPSVAEDTGLYGMGQLFIAMLTAYVDNKGKILDSP